MKIPVILYGETTEKPLYINCNADDISWDNAIAQIASQLNALDGDIQLGFCVDEKIFFITSEAEYVATVKSIQSENDGSILFAIVKTENNNIGLIAANDRGCNQGQSATSPPTIWTPLEDHSNPTIDKNGAQPSFTFTSSLYDGHRSNCPYPPDTDQSNVPWPSYPIPANPVIPEHEFGKPSPIAFDHLLKQSKHPLVNYLWQLGYDKDENYLLLIIRHFQSNPEKIREYLDIGRVPSATKTRR